MLFGRRRMQKLQTMSSSEEYSFSWRKRILSGTRWPLGIFLFLLFISVFQPFIANDKPIYCSVSGQQSFPVITEIGVQWGLWDAPKGFLMERWYGLDYERSIWPLVPYAPHTIDRYNTNFAHPFKKQQVSSLRFRHWLGTDQIGRDLFAGLISGVRTAMLIGVLSMFIASIIGITLGSIAGYFGDQELKAAPLSIFILVIALAGAIFWGRAATYLVNGLLIQVLVWIALFVGFLGIGMLLARILRRTLSLSRRSFPADLLIMRVIEIVNAIPGLLLLLAVVAAVEKVTIWSVALIVGAIGWTNIARFVRAEILKIKNLEYVTVGKVLGYHHFKILMNHVLPNALSPVLVAVAFGMAGAILLEASLSFLGLGLPTEQVTWGRLLNSARSSTQAWWLAVFPGLAIFLTVSLFNVMGEKMAKNLEGNGE